MPKEVRARKSITMRFERSLKSISNQYRLHFKFIKKEIVKKINLQETENLRKGLEWIKKSLFSKDTRLKSEVKRCYNFCIKKLRLLHFAKRASSLHPILSLDGGGIRGIIPATFLAKIEEITGKPIAQLFKCIGGTSTGGILALGLAKASGGNPTDSSYSAAQLLKIYTEQHGEIFKKNLDYANGDTSNFSWRQHLEEAVYNPRYVSPTFFGTKFQESTLSSALTEVFVVANSVEAIFKSVFHDHKEVCLLTGQGIEYFSYDLKGLEREFQVGKRGSESSLRKSYKSKVEKMELKMADAARATSAAPTYFPPFLYKESKLLVDGGVLQNDPTVPCVLKALEKVDKKNLLVLSIGTGESYGDAPLQHIASGPSSLKTLMSFGAEMAMEWIQAKERENELLSTMLSFGSYHRFQYRFQAKAPELDDTRPETITNLQQMAQEWVKENEDYIREICRVLDPSCP